VDRQAQVGDHLRSITLSFVSAFLSLESALDIKVRPDVRRVIHLKQEDGVRVIEIFEKTDDVSPEQHLFLCEFGRRQKYKYLESW